MLQNSLYELSMIIVLLKELKCNIRCHMCILKMVWLSFLLRELNWLQDHYCVTVIYLLPIGVMQSYMLLTSFNYDQLHIIALFHYVLYVALLQAFPIWKNWLHCICTNFTTAAYHDGPSQKNRYLCGISFHIHYKIPRAHDILRSTYIRD
jgi:hypothetical protein